jgi:hypothetical protein
MNLLKRLFGLAAPGPTEDQRLKRAARIKTRERDFDEWAIPKSSIYPVRPGIGLDD